MLARVIVIGMVMIIQGMGLSRHCDAQAVLTPEQELGQILYADVNLSLNRNKSCETCHSLTSPKGSYVSGFVDKVNVESGTPVSTGSAADTFGTINAPSVGYAAFSPVFHWDSTNGVYIGGHFWNGRANTLAAQAAEPLLDPLEMAMPSMWAVVTRLKENPAYVGAFKTVYGLDLDLVPALELAPPDVAAPPGVIEVYDRMAKAIGEYEKSKLFNKFNSKYDYYLVGRAQFTPQEKRGLKLFQKKAKCERCHMSKPTVAANGAQMPPLFTDYSYDNVGIPQNKNIPGQPVSPGLGGREIPGAADQLGKHKVVSLRNVAITAPYGHNGVFKDLAQAVHFYNTRDALPRVCADNNDPGFGTECWPAPEVDQNVNTTELGRLRLSPSQEADLVAFLRTLTDGFILKDPNPPFGDMQFPPMP